MFELHSEYVGFTRVESFVRLVYGREVQLQSVVTHALYVHTGKVKVYMGISKLKYKQEGISVKGSLSRVKNFNRSSEQV